MVIYTTITLVFITLHGYMHYNNISVHYLICITVVLEMIFSYDQMQYVAR